MKTLINFINEKQEEKYSDYLRRRAAIDDKYDHENGPELNKINDKKVLGYGWKVSKHF